MYSDIKDDKLGCRCSEVKVTKYKMAPMLLIKCYNRLQSRICVGLILLVNRKDIKIHSFIHIVYKYLLSTLIMVLWISNPKHEVARTGHQHCISEVNALPRNC